MAFPSVRSTGGPDEDSGSTAPTVTLPTTVEAGDLLLVLFNKDGGTNDLTWDNSTHGTWTLLWDESVDTGGNSVTSGGQFWGYGYAKIADGTEDAGTLTLALGTAEGSTAISICFQDWEGTLSAGTGYDINTPNYQDNTATADTYNSATASWGSADNLFCCIRQNDSDEDTGTWPTNYTGTQLEGITTNDNAGVANCAFATRALASASDTPTSGAMTPAGEERANFVFIVRPTGGIEIIVPTGPWR